MSGGKRKLGKKGTMHSLKKLRKELKIEFSI